MIVLRATTLEIPCASRTWIVTVYRPFVRNFRVGIQLLV